MTVQAGPTDDGKPQPAAPGRLFLVPNTLDFGTPEPPDVQDSVPLGSLRLAAGLSFWIAENAKTARAFLKRVGSVQALCKPLQELQITELPRHDKGQAAGAAAEAAARLLAPALAGHDIGLICEAGLPAVADAGTPVVQAAHAQGIAVRALGGTSSLLLALAASGFNGQSFAFVGYLPVPEAARAARLRELEARSRREGQTQLMIETPYRNAALLAALLDCLQPATRLSISTGLTLPGGWTRSDTIEGWRARPQAVPERVPAVFCIAAPLR